MSHDVRILCQSETRRLLVLIGFMFGAVFAFQYFELPYSNVLSSIFSSEKVPVSGKILGGTHINPVMPANFTQSNVNSTERHAFPSGANRTQNPQEAEDTGLGNDTASGKDLDHLVGLDPEKNNDIENHTGPETKLDDIFGLRENASLENRTSDEATRVPKQTKVLEDVMNLTNGGSTQVAERPIGCSPSNAAIDSDSSLSHRQEETGTSSLNTSGQLVSGVSVSPPVTPPVTPLTSLKPPRIFDSRMGAPAAAEKPDMSSKKEASHTLDKEEECRALNNDLTKLDKDTVSIIDMNDLLLQSRSSSCAARPKWSSHVDHELQKAKSLIGSAPSFQNDADLYAHLYRNVSTFKRSYELMERTLKVYIYREGKPRIFHSPGAVLKGIYASEGWFMRLMEGSKQFVTKDPKEAHLFYLPFSVRILEETLYVRDSHSFTNLIQYLKNYLDVITTKYPYWNRTSGSDHFLVGCHDWAMAVTKQYMAHCIRAVCNADMKEGFDLSKDVSLPETLVSDPKHPLKYVGGKPPSDRQTLAFFAGKMHGYLRPILLKYWENKDPDMKIFGRMPKVKGNANYINNMRSSKYCICAKGYEVNSPRVVEAILYECVPVIISDNFVPPLFEVLNWEAFAVFIAEKDIPKLKSILLSIPHEKYLHMQQSVKRVQQHFLWHGSPVKYDMFHMILHSIWYKRVFQSTMESRTQ